MFSHIQPTHGKSPSNMIYLVIIQVTPQQVLCLEFSLEGFKFLSQSIKCMFGSAVTRIDFK